ncbi:FecR family protein [Kerstersia gyiorum]|uniref:FecR family protein n=1 Tax=Kerstersia gyiorum TaxID=206506 RepID=UPI000A01F555|nr:FecR domain-containing protein [Kerstersia gyiorum]MCO7640571.1 FecR domain-containing protein [Pseudomonas sp. S 311-6]MCP1634519.1 transmembrane sensor [Kerstersia gyiorum]MCP1637931.1 transmembrane sensor [Kerstersia gyiorum]MCP1672387.1 transmembrane sensor [Kerstersia gyiorum]MCP1680467.1 transmembrane sensor [Kerstersia gyiorum]
MADPDLPSSPIASEPAAASTPVATDASGAAAPGADASHAAAALQEQATQWLLRLRSGRATVEDARAFALWRAQSPAHEAAAQALGQVLKTGRLAAARVARDASVPAWRGRRWSPARTGWQPARRALLAGALGAGGAWLVVRPPLGLWPALGEFTADFRTGAGEQRELTLGEGMDVAMNTRTLINLGAAEGAQRRVELVAGEAEFFADLPALQAPRSIQAGAGVLRVQHARLNLRHLDGRTAVSCLEGQAELLHPQRQLLLSAGQQLHYDGRGLAAVTSLDASQVSAWRQGILQFDDASLADVVAELNRYRQGRILLRDSDLGRMRVQARFSVARLDEALNQISDMAGGRVTRLPGGIVLLG